jgi:hypothetical protein
VLYFEYEEPDSGLQDVLNEEDQFQDAQEEEEEEEEK